jgi:hypothetical protein
MKAHLSLFPAALALAASLAAQTHVVPRSMAGVEGVSSSILPFGVDGPVRFMCLYDPSEFNFRGPTFVQALAVRADHSTTPPQDYMAAKQTLYMSLYLSTSTVSATQPRARFDDNHGIDVRATVGGGRIALPEQVRMPNGPRPFDVVFPFDRPTFYDLTPVREQGARPSTLVVDFRIDLMPAGDYWIDTPLLCSSSPTPFGNQGPRCVTSLSSPRAGLTLTSNASIQAGGNLTWEVREVPREGAFGVILGTQPGGVWQGIPLPFDMTSIGAPDCWLNTEIRQVFTGVSDTAGVGRITIPIPPGRHVVGSSLHAQATAFDLGANLLFFSMSRGLSSRVCGPLAVTRLWARGQMRPPPQSPIPPPDTGTVTIGSAMVIELR